MSSALPPERHQDHPARYALVKLSILRQGDCISSIHRVVKKCDIRKVVQAKGRIRYGRARPKLYLTQESVPYPFRRSFDAIESVQTLDDLKLEDENLELDYIHGEDNLREIVSSSHDSIGIILPAIPKDKFFEELSIRKVLPKKSFSLGEAEEKRYYLEAKFIK